MATAAATLETLCQPGTGIVSSGSTRPPGRACADALQRPARPGATSQPSTHAHTAARRLGPPIPDDAAPGCHPRRSRLTGSSSLRTSAPSGRTRLARMRLTRRYASTLPCRSRWSAVTWVYTATSVPRDRVGSWSSDSSSTTRWRGVRPGSSSTSGRPMLPPRSTGASPRARTAAIIELVVVLPLVPVTPTVRAGHSRRNRSTSLTTGTRPVCLDGPGRHAAAARWSG